MAPRRLLLAAPLLAGLASALPPPVHAPDFLSRLDELGDDHDSSPGAEHGDVNASTFEQVLDHFSKEDGRTFGQRYFSSDRYASGKGTGEDAVNFLCVGGEGEFFFHDWQNRSRTTDPPLTFNDVKRSVARRLCPRGLGPLHRRHG